MKNKKIFLFPILLITCSLLVLAEKYAHWFREEGQSQLPNPIEEYKKLYERYVSNTDSFQISGTIRIYDGEDRSTMKEESQFSYARSGDYCYSQLSYLQFFSDGNYLIQLDTINKMILVSRIEGQVSNPVSSLDAMFRDTAIFKVTGEISQDDDTRTIALKSDFQPNIRQCSLTYDTLSYQLKESLFEFWKENKSIYENNEKKIWIAKINYSNVELNKMDIKQRMGEVISFSNDKVDPKGRYREYEINSTF